MRLPWSRPVSDKRGTLTLLPSGDMVIGLPAKDYTEREIHELASQMRQWLDSDHPRPMLVLPFPFDVVDKR